MITYGKNAFKEGELISVVELVGKSTDEKPVNVGNGSTFFEMDTTKAFMFDGEVEEWVEL